MRATFLQFRNPKEQTPSAYFPQKTNQGKPVARYAYANESESKQGTFGKNHRFKEGSIYKNVVDRTLETVGPGAYAEDEVVNQLKKKPCMTVIHRPEIAMNEGAFEMQGYTRILQQTYMSKPDQASFDGAMAKMKMRHGRKVNDTLVFRRAIEKVGVDSDGQQRNKNADSRRRNISTFSQGSLSPTMQHVSRIRSCYQNTLDQREQLQNSRFFSPARSSQYSITSPRRNQGFATLPLNRGMNAVSMERPMTVPDTTMTGAGLGGFTQAIGGAPSDDGRNGPIHSMQSVPPTRQKNNKNETSNLQSQKEKQVNMVIVASSVRAPEGQQQQPILAMDAPGRYIMPTGNSRFKSQESWQRINQAYGKSQRPAPVTAGGRRTGATRRYNLVNNQQPEAFPDTESKAIDSRGRFMRDIVSANEAVELAIQEQKSSDDASVMSPCSNPVPASSSSQLRRVKTADRVSRSTAGKMNSHQQGSRRARQSHRQGVNKRRTSPTSTNGMATTSAANDETEANSSSFALGSTMRGQEINAAP